MIEHIPELVSAGIDSFNNEGRMKNALYVATVARTYRKAIDDFFNSKQSYRNNMDWYLTEISRCTYRHFSTGFYFGKTNESSQVYDTASYISESIYLGTVKSIDLQKGACFEQKNTFAVGDHMEIMKPSGENIPVTVLTLTDENGTPVPNAPHSRQILYVTLTKQPAEGDILRKNP
jgi:putative protease